ncbi:hypothetical protein PG996_011436 [Apiospora saccharicola]|uniref:Secreted protein n=1 Tax=Apiospora saccharicola TaxID=335842 RepID=A0ABR1UI04_9PEZI
MKRQLLPPSMATLCLMPLETSKIARRAFATSRGLEHRAWSSGTKTPFIIWFAIREKGDADRAPPHTLISAFICWSDGSASSGNSNSRHNAERIPAAIISECISAIAEQSAMTLSPETDCVISSNALL